mmetsp:Transcript_40754/g.80489  ORF Transcript_40754/g.80489 Transcript_40754/m.80489 type:complete len:230 (-) Transcript_40754:286-975(-)
MRLTNCCAERSHVERPGWRPEGRRFDSSRRGNDSSSANAFVRRCVRLTASSRMTSTTSRKVWRARLTRTCSATGAKRTSRMSSMTKTIPMRTCRAMMPRDTVVMQGCSLTVLCTCKRGKVGALIWGRARTSVCALWHWKASGRRGSAIQRTQFLAKPCSCCAIWQTRGCLRPWPRCLSLRRSIKPKPAIERQGGLPGRRNKRRRWTRSKGSEKSVSNCGRSKSNGANRC